MKKVLCILMSMLMIISVISVGMTVFLASAEDTDDENFLTSAQVPANLSDTADPYGKSDGQLFSLSTMNELYLYQSCDNDYYAYSFDNCSTASTYSDDVYWMKDPNVTNSSSTTKSVSALKDKRLSYVQSVGCDPLGHGKDDFIAFIGYSNYKVDSTWIYHTYVILQDLKTDGQPTYVYDLDQSTWAKDRDLPYYLGSAYFSIAAGDFDGDGKDSIIVYCPGTNNDLRVSELGFDGTTISKSRVVATLNDLRPASSDLLTGHDGNWQYKPTVSFAVGDFDGDGIENLAVSTGFGNPASDGGDDITDGLTKSGTSFERYTTGVSVMDYTSSNWSIKKTAWMYSQSSLKSSDDTADTSYYNVMHMGSITAADFDCDGYDEIVAVGYTSYNDKCTGKVYRDTSKGTDIAHFGDIDKSHYVYSIISYDGSDYSGAALDRIDITTLEKQHIQHDSDTMWPQIQVAAGYTNGKTNAAELFIDGVVYTAKTGSLVSNYTANIFTEHFDTVINEATPSVDMNFTGQVTAGNFDGNSGGREQFVYTVVFRENNSRDYYVYLGIVGGTTFDDTIKNGEITDYGALQNYGCSNVRDHSGTWIGTADKENASRNVQNKGDHWTDDSSKCLNIVVAAVDCDDDGTVARFNQHGFICSDPTPAAILQASPYFSSLENAGAYGSSGYGGTTSYTIGYTFSETTSKGNNISFGVGFAGDLELTSFKASLEAGYSLDWSETFEKSTTTEYSQEFNVSKDSVLVTIVPVNVYSYDIYDPDTNTFEENGCTVTVPSKPVYRLMSIDEYNKDVVEYNAAIDASSSDNKANKLIPITYGASLSDTVQLPEAEGNPYAYQAWTNDNTTNIEIKSKSYFGTGIAGGSVSSSFDSEFGSSHSEEMAHGFNFSLTLQGGGKAGNVELWGGGYVHLDYSRSSGITVSTSSSEGGVGQVCDPSPCDLVTASELQKYYFTWQLAWWKVELTEKSNTKTPVVGYAVSTVTSPVNPPENLKAEFNINNADEANSAVTLTWDAPESVSNGPGVNGYYIYDDGEQINNQIFIPGDSNNISYTINSVVYGSKHHYTVRAETSGTKYLSTPSNEVVLGWANNAVSITSITKDETYVSEDGLTDKYIVLYSDDTQTFFYVTNGKDGETAYEAAVANGYTGTYDEWLKVTGVTCAVKGHTYKEYSIPASCGVKGLTIKVCTVCGAAEIEEVPALEHNYTALQVIKPTCTAAGYTIYKCSVCGDQYIADFTDPVEHTFKTKVIANTCVSEGFTIKYCEVCGYMEMIDSTQAKGHSFSVTKVVEPTCTTKGYSVYTCTDCGVSYMADEKDCTAHTFTDKVIAPDCKHTGYTIHTCTECGYAYIDSETPATAHVPGEWICEDPATGKYVRRCEECYTILDTKTVAIEIGNGSLDSDSPALDENGVLNLSYKQSEQLKLSSSGAEAEKVIYTSSNPKVAEVDAEGNVTAVVHGDAVITATVPGTAIELQVPVKVELTWWQRVHYVLNSIAVFRILFMLFGVDVSN